MLNLIKLKNNPEINIINIINDFKNPAYIYIPILNNKTFKSNEYIYKNDIIDNFISSISGTINNTKEIYYNNKIINSIEILNDYKENTNTKKRYKKIHNKEELLNILKEYKLDNIYNKINNIDNIKNLIITSIDEEIYSLKELFRLENNYNEILETIDYLINILNLNKSLLAIKSTNFKSIKNVKSIIGTYPNIKINLVPDKYLISYDNFLCEYLNININETLILNTNMIYNIYLILKGINITEKLITISGNAIEKSLIINVKLYTSLKEIIKEYINIIDNNYDIYINGYLMGKKIDNKYIDLIIITKDIDSIIINKKETINETECINCGACQKICPFNINVLKCYKNKLTHKNCISCGLCNYICPANIDLKKVINNEEI